MRLHNMTSFVRAINEYELYRASISLIAYRTILNIYEMQLENGLAGSALQLRRSVIVLCTMAELELWERFYDVECQLNVQLAELGLPSGSLISHAYNPVDYAKSLHCAYLRRYLNGTKRIMFIGMNPGPNGMAQTGIPFGNVRTVRDLMQLSGDVLQPPLVHPKRPVKGLDCSIEEPSGVRLWGLFQGLAGGSLATFSQHCFVHNFCPLSFFDDHGHNITPSELRGDFGKHVREICLQALEQQLNLVQPRVVVAVGDYVFRALKRSSYCNGVTVLQLPHPSRRACAHNANWPEKAELFLQQHDLIRFLRNES